MREINHILCPVDLSDISQHVNDHAVVLARWYKARITALHVCNPIVIPSTGFTLVGTEIMPMLTEDEAKEIRAQVLTSFGSVTANDVDVLVETGHPANQILKLAKSLPADLVVIGTHGVGRFEHLILGSVTEKVMRKATCPVLTVPPRTAPTSRLPFKKILCPVDFSEPSLAALNFAFSLAQESEAELTILHVFDWLTGDEPLTNQPISVPEYRSELENDLTRKLQLLVPNSVWDWCRPSTLTAHGKAYREILRVAAERDADLIVMGVHGRNAFDLMMFGSTTNQVVRRATCPVLTLRR